MPKTPPSHRMVTASGTAMYAGLDAETVAAQREAKSFSTRNPVVKYVAELSTHEHELQAELTAASISRAGIDAKMLGAPEVLELGANLIRLTGARRCIDIGTFTGASALSWALATCEDAEILSMDVDHTHLNKIGRPILQKRTDLYRKSEFRLAPALETLDCLLADGQAGTWDFAFIDADKLNYPAYYDRCVELLRIGGIILIDNALWGGTAPAPNDVWDVTIDEVNRAIAATRNTLLALSDGVHLVFKI